MDWNTKLLELAENGQVTWEEIARECIAQMSVDDAEDVATALGLDEDDFTDDLAEDEDEVVESVQTTGNVLKSINQIN